MNDDRTTPRETHPETEGAMPFHGYIKVTAAREWRHDRLKEWLAERGDSEHEPVWDRWECEWDCG